VTRTVSSLDARWAAWHDRRPTFVGTHLDVAAAGRMSRAVLDDMTAHLQRETEIGAYPAEAAVADDIASGRALIGDLLGVSTDGVAFVESASGALRSLLAAWPLPERATIAIAPGEWGPNVQAFRARGLAVRTLDVDGRGIVDVHALQQLLHHDPPAAVHLDHVAAHTGAVQPVADVLALCRAVGVPLWVDAAQALGHVDTTLGADAVYATSRKWLCGPRGVGVLAVAPGWWSSLRAEPYPLDPDRPVVQRLEPSEGNIAGRVGLCAAVRELADDGPGAVQERLREVGRQTRDALTDLPGWEVVDAGPQTSAITALRPTAGQDVTLERHRLLTSYGLLTTASRPVRAPLDAPQPMLRISPHVDATVADIESAAAALDIRR